MDKLPQGKAKAAIVEDMFDRIAPRYDLVNRLMTFRLDVRWRRKTVRELSLPKGSKILDLACGTGDMCNDLLAAGLYPIGIDFSQGMLGASRTLASLVRADVLCLPLPESSIDGVTCGFALRNFTNLDAFFQEISRVVKPAGRIALLDVAQPKSRILRTGHTLYFGKIVPLIGSALSDKSAYRYLPKSVSYLPPPDEMMQSLKDSGFSDAKRQLLSGGITQMITATRDL